MTSQHGKQTTAIHILPNISRSKGNPTMKLGQLVEYNIKSIFLKKYRRFSKKSKLSIYLDQ